MRNVNALLSATFVLVAAFAVTPAGAQPPGSPSGASAAKVHKAVEKGEPHSLKAADKAGPKGIKADEKRDKVEEKEAKADAKAAARADAGLTAADGGPSDAAKARHRGRGFRALGVDFQHGTVTKEQLKERIQAMQASREARKKEDREEVKRRWGSALLHPSCREELRHHARREAFLTRALFVAQTEVTGKKRDSLIERIEKLIDKEDERHARAMERLKSTPIPPASAMPASAASAAPAMPSAVPAAASSKVPAHAHSASKAGGQ